MESDPMTDETKIETLLASKPYYVMCGPDIEGNAMYGCVTDEGRKSFHVNEDTMFAGFPGDNASAPAEKEWRHDCAKRMGALRGNLLHACIGHFADTPEIQKDPRVGEFIWRTIHNSGEPMRLEKEEFLTLFKTCASESSVPSTQSA